MNDLGFHKENREVDIVDDPRLWGKLAEFVAVHPSEEGCGRPNYVRATVGHSGGAIEIIGQEDTWWGRLATKLYRVLPILFGTKVVLCATCQNMVFVSPGQHRIYKFMQLFNLNGTAKMLILHEDGRNVPEDRIKTDG